MELKPGYKQTDVGLIPQGWDIRVLKHCCTKLNVSFVGTCEPFYINETSGVLMIRTGNLQYDKIILSEVKYVTREFHARNQKSQVHAGDILIARHGNSGNAVLVPDIIDDVNALSIIILRTNKDLLTGAFATYAINSHAVKSQASNLSAGSTQVVINTREVANLIIPLPPLKEQAAIAQALSDADRLIESLEQLIVKKRYLKQGVMQELLTGKKRLPGFSGEWELKQLGKLARCFSGGTPLTGVPAYYDGNIPWITSGDLNKEQIVDVEGRISQAGLENSAAKMVDANTLLIALYGATAGVSGIARIRAAINQAVLAVVPNGDNTDFLYYKLQSLKAYLVDTYIQGGQPNLSGDILKSLEIPMPQLEEQTAIATVLSDMGTEIATLEAKLGKARQIKQGMMQELFTGNVRLI